MKPDGEQCYCYNSNNVDYFPIAALLEICFFPLIPFPRNLPLNTVLNLLTTDTWCFLTICSYLSCNGMSVRQLVLVIAWVIAARTYLSLTSLSRLKLKTQCSCHDTKKPKKSSVLTVPKRRYWRLLPETYTYLYPIIYRNSIVIIKKMNQNLRIEKLLWYNEDEKIELSNTSREQKGYVVMSCLQGCKYKI